MKFKISVGYFNKEVDPDNVYALDDLDLEIDAGDSSLISLKGVDILYAFSIAASNVKKPEGYSADDIMFDFSLED